MRLLERGVFLLVALFCVDRLLKVAAVSHFFRQPRPAPPVPWPSVTLLQPITWGVHDLAHNLTCRLELDYPGPLHHLLICDQADLANQAICQTVSASHPAAQVEMVIVRAAQGKLASKIEKLQAALPYASGEILCFVDDDVGLRPRALRELIPYLQQPGAGAVFGLACYTNWRNFWSSAMSGFVNANALLSYIPVTYLTEPFTITGHCFALKRAVFQAVGGLEHMTGRVDDDHELARRLRRHGLRCLQTPMIYDVDNNLPTLSAYLAQMQRWFVFPRLLMLPYLSGREQALMLIGSLGNFLPPVVTLAALAARTRHVWRGWLVMLGIFALVYIHGERAYLGRTIPARRLAALVIVAIVAPLQIGWGLLAGNEVQWRGQRLRIGRDGRIEVLE